MNNRITNLFGIRYPVISGGMVWCSGWRLASAVSNAGGLGLIGAGSMHPDTLREHIVKCKAATDKPFGVNVPLLYPEMETIIDIIISEKVPIVFTSAGNPAKWTPLLKSHGITVAHVVSSSKFARKCEEAGVDAVVAEGFEAGGHNGREETTTMCLIPAVRQATSLPLIAAGGIASGEAIAAVMALGAEGVQIGAVENLQGISWQRITIEGAANHAGTTPTALRIDAGLAAAKVNVFLRERCLQSNGKTVATVGCIEFEPNAVNVIPSKAVFTADVRNPDETKLKEEEQALADYLKELEKTDKVRIHTERLVRFEPVLFDEGIVTCIEKVAKERGFSCRRMTSGAGQDAQMIARMCPTAMIFVPSVKGISHNPEEFTPDKDLLAGANVFLDVVKDFSSAK